MTTIAILIILIALGLYGLQEYYQIKLGTKPRRTPANVATNLAALLNTDQDDNEQQGGRCLDLGSGYGDMVLNLARLLPLWEVDGVEKNPTPWIISNLRTIGKNFTNYRFYIGDATEWSLRGYDVVFVHQEPKILKQWEANIARRLPVGTLLVCLNGQLPRIKPTNTIKIDAMNTFYIYQKRAKEAAPPETTTGVFETPLPVTDVTVETQVPPPVQTVATQAVANEETPVTSTSSRRSVY